MIMNHRDDELNPNPSSFRGSGSEAYNTALQMIAPRFSSTLGRLRSMKAAEIAVIASPWDDMVSLLDIASIPFTMPIHSMKMAGKVKVLVVGCPLRDQVLSPFDILQVLNNGGIVVSSDKAAAWTPVLSDLLCKESQRGPARGRVVFNDRYVIEPSDNGLLPVVWLDAGHIPLSASIDRHHTHHVLATNALTEEPLGVVVEFGGGCFLHAVPHWWQPALGQSETALESRQAIQAPGYRDCLPPDSRLTVGEFVSAKAMLTLMLSGFECAFTRLDHSCDQHHASTPESLSED